MSFNEGSEKEKITAVPKKKGDTGKFHKTESGGGPRM